MEPLTKPQENKKNSSAFENINNSYTKKLVFGIGLHTGFFSEINNMVLAIVFSLNHKIQFNLHSESANFKINKGWTDYFLPFCPEIEDSFLNLIDSRYKTNFKLNITKPRRMYRMLKYNFLIWHIKRKHGITYLTFDLWDDICNRGLEKIYYSFPELNIYGDLQDSCKGLLKLIWRYNKKTEEKIAEIIQQLQLPDEYIGFQIRRGDKIGESDFISVDKYIMEASKRSCIRNAFVFTDDYSVIEKLTELYPSWNFYTLCNSSERGYSGSNFYKRDKELIYPDIINLLANIEILRQSILFIGTFSANPSMFLGMVMDKDKTVSVDVDWQVWHGKSTSNSHFISRNLRA